MSGIWWFGNVRFDESSGNLQVGSDDVELDRSCQRILGVLLANAGQGVDKDALLRAGWPGRLVHENSLAKAIGRLRIALGEHGERLGSVYGHGYKLDVSAQLVTPEREEGLLATVGAALSDTPGRRPWLAWSAGAAGMAAVGVILSSSESVAGIFGTPYRTADPIVADAPDAIGKILWVDDHPENNAFEKQYFEKRRIAVHSAANTADAIKLLAIYDYKLVISDMGRGDDRLAGLKLVEQMRQRGDATPVVIYTVRADGAKAQSAQRRLVADAGARRLAVTPQEIRSIVVGEFGNPSVR
ncbi:response regulator [Altererythrobacter salegens]|uniref:Response regulator n=1 Tax=Croceibacterium salegens TaxID=1737568 RepID=A0A6I4SST2_9SPHN|nr:response regulator [Croceibacterium salegens]MXO58943.1 response regulator [Croceibacterium salegens]